MDSWREINCLMFDFEPFTVACGTPKLEMFFEGFEINFKTIINPQLYENEIFESNDVKIHNSHLSTINL